jgi:CAAX prenyl protease-like protein
VSWQSIAIGLVVYVLWICRSLFAVDSSALTRSSTMNLSAQWAGLWVIAHVIGSVITVPVAEELAFRGFLSRRLISADFASVPAGRFTWFSFVISSVAFGLLHHHWIEGIAAGMLYALAYYRRGSIGDAVVAHATTNGILSVQALLIGDWSIIS